MVFERCISELEAIGYEVWPVIIPACATDAKHRRDRVWILAANARRNDGAESECQHERPEIGCGSGEDELVAGKDVAHSGHGCGRQGGIQGHGKDKNEMGKGTPNNLEQSSKDVANPEGSEPRQSPKREGREDSGGGSGNIRGATQAGGNPMADSDRTGQREADRIAQSGFCLLVDGLPDGLDGRHCTWPEEPQGIPRVAGGVQDRVNKLKGLGNAILPQVAAELMAMIKEIENARST